jgi:hypothetical protein
VSVTGLFTNASEARQFLNAARSNLQLQGFVLSGVSFSTETITEEPDFLWWSRRCDEYRARVMELEDRLAGRNPDNNPSLRALQRNLEVTAR